MFKIPFIQQIGIGLYIAEQYIYWVECSRIGDSVKVEEFEQQAIQTNIGEALSKLLERVSPKERVITVNVPVSECRYFLFDVPIFEKEKDFDQWISDKEKSLLPSGLDPSSFVKSFYLFGKGENQKVFFVITRRETIAGRLELLEKFNLAPYAVTPGVIESYYGMIFDKDFVNDCVYFLPKFRDNSFLLEIDQGALSDFWSLEPPIQDDLHAHIGEAEAQIVAKSESHDQDYTTAILYVTTDSNPSLFESINNSESILGKLQPAYLQGTDFSDEEIGSEYIVAAGLATKQLYPAMDSINFLSFQTIEAAKEKLEKKDFIRVGALMTICMGMMFSVLFFVQFVLGFQLEKTSDEVAKLDDKISAVTQARDQVVEWQKKVDETEKLIGDRSSISFLMEVIGRSISENIWLNQFLTTKVENNTLLTLSGFAKNDRLIADLMQKLESKTFMHKVELIISEQVDMESFYDSDRYHNEKIIRYEIRIQIKENQL